MTINSKPDNCGSAYLSGHFQDEVSFLGLESSPSFIRQPEGNGVVERFFKTLKEQLLWIQSFDSIQSLRNAVEMFIKKYHALYPNKWYIIIMAAFRVIARKAALKRIRKAPERVQERFALLLGDLAGSGPFRAEWPNYSPLGDDRYHCHLGYSWVACWSYQKEIVTIEVYYAGSRESAPY